MMKLISIEWHLFVEQYYPLGTKFELWYGGKYRLCYLWRSRQCEPNQNCLEYLRSSCYWHAGLRHFHDLQVNITLKKLSRNQQGLYEIFIYKTGPAFTKILIQLQTVLRAFQHPTINHQVL